MTKSVMTRKEIGSKGGKARANEYSKQDLSQQAKQGAKTVEERRPGFHSEIGQRGGQARAEKYSHEELSEQAQKGAETIEKLHPGFHSEIGSKGGKSRSSQKTENTDDILIDEDYTE